MEDIDIVFSSNDVSDDLVDIDIDLNIDENIFKFCQVAVLIMKIHLNFVQVVVIN